MTRVLTLNLQHGVLGRTGEVATATELTDVLAPVRAEAPDVLAVQEVDRGQPRSGRLDQARAVADAAGLAHVRFAAALEGDLAEGRTASERGGDHPGPAYGVAIASRYPVLATFVRPLPDLSALLPGPLAGWAGPGVDEPRVLLAAVLQAPTGPLAVACTHLSTLVPVALAQLRQVLASVRTLGAPALVCGDLNLGSAPVALATRGWRRARALTFPQTLPDRQVDHLLLAPGTTRARLAAARSLPLGVSDHRGLSAELRL